MIKDCVFLKCYNKRQNYKKKIYLTRKIAFYCKKNDYCRVVLKKNVSLQIDFKKQEYVILILRKTMSTEKKQNPESKNLAVGEAISRTEMFVERNKKIITIIVCAIVVVIAGFLAYKNFIVKPREKAAQADMFAAEHYFDNDEIDKALNGDGKHLGFLAIIDKYSSTTSGNLANYYAGLAYMSKGEFQKAITYFEDFSTEDMFTNPDAMIGDCYMELNQTDKAISSYEKALKDKDQYNDMTTPFTLFKLGQAYEIKNDNKNALETYKRIKKEFPLSSEARDIDKYITRLENL